ncbi:reelin domain-containing protein 1-like [Gambusia affinis]|uniref:reelin domain-containing protein 1-like n=1 Tax=Gambusia affinis TaxID=33528 RepID=UPI001CDCEC9F|nr:reelin domain-containing protein 1-like [Gambusia affinis]
MMSSNLLLWGGAMLLCSMAPPIICFSHGASLTSCQEMIPGHIRAHPLNLKHSFITLQTSSSSYLPGQLITVTVRSSRDFMGFLLQARSVGGERNGLGEGPGVRPERPGPLLVGGSWIRLPPGTHTLRCLFEGDTVTHSDKQLKRNLSFVWRAPDMPKGDIRFHITVVQSYFVYWTGIESAVVCDRSPSAWRRSKTKMADGASTIVAVQETVTAQTANRKATLALFSGRPSNIKNATEILTVLKLQTKDDHTTLETNSSVTRRTVAARKTLTSESPQSTTNESPGFLTGVSKRITTEPFSYTSVFPLPSSPPDTVYTVTTKQFPLASFSTLNSLVPLQMDTWTKSNDLQKRSQELKLKNNPGGKHYKTFTVIPTQGPTMETFFSTRTPVDHTLTDPNKNKSRKSETSSSSEKLGDNVPSNSQSRIVKTEVTQSYQRSLFNSSRFQMVADPKSQTNASQTSLGPKSTPKQTSSPKKTIPNFHQTQPISLQGENTQFDSSTETLRPFSQPLSQTRRVFSQSTLTPQPVTVSSGENDPTSEGNTKTLAPVVGFVPSNTSSSFASHSSENFTSVTSTSSIHFPSHPSQNEPQTTPNHSVPAPPSPISIPHHLTSTKYQTSTPPTFSTSSTISSFSASNYPTRPSLPTSISPTSSTFSSSTPSFSVTSPSLRVSLSSFISPISSPEPEPTSAPHKITLDQKLVTQTHHAPNSETRFTSPAHRKVVHPNPKPYPNLRPNHDQEIKPNIQNTDTKAKHPSDPADAPDKEGKYPDIVPRHSAWELGMLLGCSVGLGMVLVVGLRYVYRQACGRRTEVTLNDRERENGRGDQGLVHLQECGDLVRVRKIRENSFVFLAEYDILAPPSN